MGLKDNIYYWNKSLEREEKFSQNWYSYDKVIISKRELIEKIEKLRTLISNFCNTFDHNDKDRILSEILLLLEEKEIQYNEFIAFWKTQDLSFSVFLKLRDDQKKEALEKIMSEYCNKRMKLYENPNSVVIQALYDSSSSRRKGNLGTNKLESMIDGIFHGKVTESYRMYQNCYFLPDKNKEFFRDFLKESKIKYDFGKNMQGKVPDMVLIVSNHVFIVEAKHINELGGAQDKQILELIQFIKYSESMDNIHYLSFLDGIYFNLFSEYKRRRVAGSDNKIKKQFEDIEKAIKNNKNNFFVNTYGFELLLEDLNQLL